MSSQLFRAVQAFDLLAAEPKGLSVTELAEKLKTSKSTSSRLLATLVEAGLVQRDDAQRHFLDVRFWTWGVQAARRQAFLDVARPHIAIAVRETGIPAYVAVVRGDQTIYLESVTLSHNDAMYNLVSYVVPVYACAPGKAILAFSQQPVREAVLQSPLRKFTPRTVATPEELRAELDEIRRTGYSINRGEYYENNRLAAAVPLFDQTGCAIASVCFYGMEEQEQLDSVIPRLRQLGEVISSSLGYNQGLHMMVS